jgi:HTH-type transcriptional regulator, sugar sensing transcriptional regulator
MDASDVERLVELGLTGYEASAYIALTRRGEATASEVARLAELPRQRIYDVLDGLVAQGFATVKPGRPARYTAASPDDALWRSLDRRRAELAELGAGIAETIARLAPAYQAGRSEDDPLRFIELLREPSAIAKRFAALEAAAEREILVFTKPPYAVEPAENVEGLKLLERQIEARSVYERSIHELPGQAAAIRRFISAGEQARVVDELPLKLVVIDERIALFTLQDPVAGTPALTIMIVEHPALARLLKLAFEAVWAVGEPFT